MSHIKRFLSCMYIAALLLAVGIAFSLLPNVGVQADGLDQAGAGQEAGQPVVIYLFWGDGCPHCAAAKPFLEGLTIQYPNVELRAYEVWYNETNQQLMQSMTAAYGFEPSAVPTIFIGEHYWVGYSDTIQNEIASVVDACSRQGCRDAGAGIMPGVEIPASVQPSPQTSAPRAEITASGSISATNSAEMLSLPLIGTINLSAQSLALSTALIAFVDGFNPCSLWALSVLLALTLHTGSRKKVFLIGAVFLLVTSAVYMLFITGLFTMFAVVSFVGWIQVIVALVALFFAAVNIKDYLWYKEGISFTIPDEKKPGIYKGMRRVLDAGDSFGALVAATVALSAGVSLVEFSCTAGFPVLWTNLLISQKAAALTFGLLLLLYMLIYQIDELGIFLLAVFSLRASKLEEKHGRILKLIGGMLMLTLAVVMLVNPAWMNQISTSLIVFVVAFGLTALALGLHRYLLPRFGIFIGSELAPARKKTTHRAHHHHS